MDLRIAAFKEAMDKFAYLARIDLAEIKEKLADERLIDGFQNGRAQKFEYTTELCWKAIKAFLNLILARLPDYASLFERIGRQLTKEAE